MKLAFLFVFVTCCILGGSLAVAAAALTPRVGDPLSAIEVVKVKNRARTLGNSPSGARVRYFAVSDQDVAGKKGTELRRRLRPATVTAASGVTRAEVVVDIRRPLVIAAPRRTPLRIGTVTIGKHLRKIEVRSSLYLSHLKVIDK